jgi:hypothetical protein
MKVILATIILVFLTYPIPKGKYLGMWNGCSIWLDFRKDSCYISIVGVRVVEKWSAQYISQDSIIQIIEPKKNLLYGDRYIIHRDSIYCSLVPCRMVFKKKMMTAISIYDTLGRTEIQLKQSEEIYFKKKD